MEQTESVVIYYGLPVKQGFVHAVDLPPRDAYRAWRAFLETCTVHRPVLCRYHVHNHDPSMGLPREPHLEGAIDEAFPRDSSSRPWRSTHPVEEERIAEALDLLEALEPKVVDRWGNTNAELCFWVDFELRKPVDGGWADPWPGQDPVHFGNTLSSGGCQLGRSESFLRLGARQGMQLNISLPLATDAEVEYLIPRLQRHLPFQLIPSRWIRATLTKNGHTYRDRRLFR